MSRIESFDIDIPQLKRMRTVWVYIPDNYTPHGRPQPVIYMHDGQNLFYDRLTAYGTAWHIDKAMDTLYAATGRSAIVIGVECNDRRRFSEYSPWKIHSRKEKRRLREINRGGEGAVFAEFFAHALKKAVDRKYNTDRCREATAVIGSSMGGLISCYLGITYQDVYETMGLFSTYTPFNQGRFDHFLRHTPQVLHQHALVYCGGKEGLATASNSTMLKASGELYRTLSKRGISCELLLNSDMKHYETAWDVYFRKFAADFLERYENYKKSNAAALAKE